MSGLSEIFLQLIGNTSLKEKCVEGEPLVLEFLSYLESVVSGYEPDEINYGNGKLIFVSDDPDFGNGIICDYTEKKEMDNTKRRTLYFHPVNAELSALNSDFVGETLVTFVINEDANIRNLKPYLSFNITRIRRIASDFFTEKLITETISCRGNDRCDYSVRAYSPETIKLVERSCANIKGGNKKIYSIDEYIKVTFDRLFDSNHSPEKTLPIYREDIICSSDASGNYTVKEYRRDYKYSVSASTAFSCILPYVQYEEKIGVIEPEKAI
jgi:hypothetical protein